VLSVRYQLLRIIIHVVVYI